MCKQGLCACKAGLLRRVDCLSRKSYSSISQLIANVPVLRFLQKLVLYFSQKVWNIIQEIGKSENSNSAIQISIEKSAITFDCVSSVVCWFGEENAQELSRMQGELTGRFIWKGQGSYVVSNFLCFAVYALQENWHVQEKRFKRITKLITTTHTLTNDGSSPKSFLSSAIDWSWLWPSDLETGKT